MSFASQLKLAQHKLGLNGQDFAERLGISHSTYIHYAAGHTVPNIDFAVNVSKTAGIPIEDLLECHTLPQNYLGIAERIEVLFKMNDMHISAENGDIILTMKNIKKPLMEYFKGKILFESSGSSEEVFETWYSAMKKKLEGEPI